MTLEQIIDRLIESYLTTTHTTQLRADRAVLVRQIMEAIDKYTPRTKGGG